MTYAKEGFGVKKQFRIFPSDAVLEGAAALFNNIDQAVRMHRYAAVSAMSGD